MKNKLFLFLLVSSLLCGCSRIGDYTSSGSSRSESGSSTSESSSNGSSSSSSSSSSGSSSSSSSEEQPVEGNSIQDMNILHAWNWKLNDIKSRLSAIQKAGYGAIQISPMQPKVDKTNWSGESTKSQWWKLYQPLAFKVAESGETFLGTKSDLTSLCNEASKYDIEIVVDIVSNHLAGDANGYNSQVYKKYPLHNYGKAADDNDGESVVKGHINLPDIDTSNKDVQKDVLAMLKDYIDCGVSGFRFDAAKHIETPDDGSYASDYWPTVLNGTTEYAESKYSKTPYYYGEILTTPGKGRSFSSYTKYMSVVDNKQATTIIDAVGDKKLSSITSTYNSKVNPDHLVLWAESHDTYANDSGYESTRSYTTDVVNKAYMIQASRKDAATLYFARPSSMDVTVCSINDNSGWKNPEIAAVNEFHKLFLGKSESISNNNNCFVNVRGNSGAAIVNINASSTQSVDVKGLADGTYVDLISKKEFTVSNQKVTVSFTNGACLLVTKGSVPVGPAEPTYSSNIVLKGYNQSLVYFAWVWPNGKDGAWKPFSQDGDAIGFNLSANENYIIVEFPSGTTTSNINWDKKIRQTIDYSYSGSQIIYDYSGLTWK